LPGREAQKTEKRKWVVYLCIDGESRLPVIGRDNSAYSVLFAFWRNLLDVCHGVFEFLLGWAKGRGFGDAMGTHSLRRFAGIVGLTAALNG
jgi:hypothetical protein